jgi:hypothetical protein
MTRTKRKEGAKMVKGYGLEEKWAARWAAAVERKKKRLSQGERGREEEFCFKKRKEEGFIKPYEKETN